MRVLFKKFQTLVEVIGPTLEKLAVQISQLRQELLIIFDESSFDSTQLNFLSKIPELVPILTKNQLSLTVKDLSTKKIHFQQITSEIEFEKSNSISELVNFIETQQFFLKSLEKNPSIIFISNAAISTFKIPQAENLIIISKDHIEIDDLPQFRKITFEEV